MSNNVEDIILSEMSDSERELNKLFRENDKELELSRIYLGALRVYKDNINPDKNTLVAHSIREINKILPKKYPISIYAITDAPDGIDVEKEIKSIVIESFDKLPMLDESEVNRVVDKWSGYYKATHRQQFKQMLVTSDEEQALPMTILNKIDEILSALIKLNKWFVGYAHQGNRSEAHLFDEKWQLIQDIWRNILSPFYGATNEIDAIISVETPDEELFRSLLSKMIRPKLVEYLFRNLDKSGWFDSLKNAGMIDNVQPPIKNNESDIIQSIPWWPGYYLLKVADKIPEKVTPLLAGLKTNDNWNALDLCFQITLKLPTEYARQLFPNIDKWLDSNTFQIGDKYATDLLGRFVDAKDYESALQIFDIISKPVKKDRTGTSLRSDLYYNEDLKHKYLPALVQNNPEKVLEIIEKRLNEVIKIDKSTEDDYSYIWRPSIGESEENAIYGDAENIYVEMLRDALTHYYKGDQKATKTKTEEYLGNKYSIYKRIAIYIIDSCDMSECYEKVLTNKDFLGAYELSREYFVLLRNKYALLDINAKKKILELIESGPGKGVEQEQVKQWTEKRLYKIGDIALQDERLKEHREFINKYKSGIDAAEKEIGIGTGKHWVGPTSPKTIEEIKEMKPDEIIDFIKNVFKPSGTYWQPTPEGLGRTLGTVIKENPGPYADIAERFAEDGIYPAYTSNLLRALHDAWREKKKFEWDSVMKLCEAMLYKTDPEEKKDRKDAFDYGRYSWTRGAVADLLGEAVRTDEHVINDKYLPAIKKILFYIAEKDADPDVSSREETSDYISEAINCNRGKALEAIVLYALRFARITVDKEAEKGKGPFPPGEKLEKDVKEFLEKRMVEELSPSVHSMFGRYFQFLYYLDKEWVKKKVEDGVLFTKDKDRIKFWEADWQGYIMSNRFYDELYGLLKPNYRIAIDKATEDKKGREALETRRLGEFIMVAYIRGLVTLEEKDSLVKFLFEKTSLDVRSHAVWFIGSLFREEPPDSETWNKLKELWKYRLESVDDEERGSFVDWMKWLPETIKDLYALVEKSMKAKGKIFHQNGYYEYLIKIANDYPKETLQLTSELLNTSHKNKRLYYGYQKSVKQILDAVQPKASEYKDIINKIVNFLGEIGDYGFREYLVK